MKKITILLLSAISSILVFAENVTLTETYARVVQTSASGANTLSPGDYFVWKNYRFRRSDADKFSDTQTQAGWFSSQGYLFSTQAVEGGIKTLSFDWAQFGAEPGRMLRLMINIDGVDVGSILREGDLGACPKQIYTNTAVNSKKNAVLRFNNTSYEQASGNPCHVDFGRFLIGNITWTPYLWYSTKKVSIEVGQTYTNTSLINNLDEDMADPAFSSSNTAVATVNSTTGEVTALSEGSVTITASSGDISVTYNLKVAEDALTETYANVVQTSAAGNDTKWNGDYFEWTVANIRRGLGDVFPDSRDQGGWFSTSNTIKGLIESTNPIEGGIKTLSFPWAQFGNESTKTLKMVIKLDGVRVDSIVRENTTTSAYGTETTYTNNAINCKKNATLGLYNNSFNKTTPTNPEGRFVLGNITWTPYIWYRTKSVTIPKGTTYTNTDFIDNLDEDMDAPTYSSSNTAIATVNPTTGEITALNSGNATITATTGQISTSYQVTVEKDMIISSNTNISALSVSEISELIISASELTIDQPTNVKSINILAGGRLTVSGTNTLATTDGITLESDNSGTATLIDNYNTPTLTATVKQYVTAGRNWYMTVPINNTISYEAFNKGTSVVEYDETQGDWATVSNGRLTSGKGYIQVASSTEGTTGTVEFTGLTNSGDIPVTLTYTANKGKGFNLIGNPYPSYLNWPAVVTANPDANMPTGTMWYRTINFNEKEAWTPDTEYNADDVVYNGTRFYKAIQSGTSASSGGPTGTQTDITDNTVTWNYDGSVYVFATVNALGVSTPEIVSRMIPPMQAFWVKSTGGTLTFKNSMRTHNYGESNRLKAPNTNSRNTPLIRLRITNGTSSDETVIYADENASNTFDKYDAPKFFNNTVSNQPEIFSVTENNKLSINAINRFYMNQEMAIGFATEKKNNFSISASAIKNIDSDVQLIITDKQTNKEFNLTSGQAYHFHSTPVNTINRFNLLLRNKSITTNTEDTKKNNTQIFVNTANQIVIIAPEKYSYTIFNTTGQAIASGIISNNRHISTKFSSGVYIVKLNNQSTKLIVK